MVSRKCPEIAWGAPRQFLSHARGWGWSPSVHPACFEGAGERQEVVQRCLFRLLLSWGLRGSGRCLLFLFPATADLEALSTFLTPLSTQIPVGGVAGEFRCGLGLGPQELGFGAPPSPGALCFLDPLPRDWLLIPCGPRASSLLHECIPRAAWDLVGFLED